MNLTDLEARNWEALAAYHRALTAGTEPHAAQQALVDKVTGNAVAYSDGRPRHRPPKPGPSPAVIARAEAVLAAANAVSIPDPAVVLARRHAAAAETWPGRPTRRKAFR